MYQNAQFPIYMSQSKQEDGIQSWNSSNIFQQNISLNKIQ